MPPINISIPHQDTLSPRILICGVGGAGGNAVNNMIRNDLSGVDFLVLNTDSQALGNNMAQNRLQLGTNLTKGMGAGAKPEMGRAAAEEEIDDIHQALQGINMVFIAAGMGGGTGTGAAPVVARAARELGILTVGVVTKPFGFEGAHRMRLAESGISELQQYVDTLIVIPNQNLFRLANEKTTFADAFKMADDVLHSGVRGVTDLITMPGMINLDFNDIRSVMAEMGKAMMGTGEATGASRALDAAEAAIRNPLLDDVSMRGARGVLINITGGNDMTLYEVDTAANRIREEVDPDANIIFGSTFNPELDGSIRVSVVATGIDAGQASLPKTASFAQPGTPFSVVQNRPTTPANYTPSATYQAQVTPAQNATPQTAPMQQQRSTTPTTQSSAPSNQGYTQLNQSTPSTDSEWNEPAQTESQTATQSTSAPQSYSQSHTAPSQSGTMNDTSFASSYNPAPTTTPVPVAQSYVPEAQQQQPNHPVRQANQQANQQQQPSQPQGLQGNFEERQRRGPSLFERAIGGIRGGQPAQPQQQQQPLQQSQLSPSSLTTSQTQQPQTEDELEIPAFLRRQSN